jgi:hypothetical protein
MLRDCECTLCGGEVVELVPLLKVLVVDCVDDADLLEKPCQLGVRLRLERRLEQRREEVGDKLPEGAHCYIERRASPQLKQLHCYIERQATPQLKHFTTAVVD